MSQLHLVVSEPCIIVPPKLMLKPLGNILQEADLVSAAQIMVALQDQNFYHDLRIGEILALRGWLKQQTADFFVLEWPSLLEYKQHYPLGYYLRAAGLLDEEQIHLLLSEQETIGLKFGALAVLKGWLKPTTLEFFLKNLRPNRQNNSPFIDIRRNLSLNKESEIDETVGGDTLTDKPSEQYIFLQEISEKETLVEQNLAKVTLSEEEEKEYFEDEYFLNEEDEDCLDTELPTQLMSSNSNNFNAIASFG
jgi:hypothetical protein